MKDLYGTQAEASAAIDEICADEQKWKVELNRVWERNAAFINGNQTFSNFSSGTAQLTNNQMFISGSQDKRNQMYVTNEIEPITRSLVSFMTRSKPDVECFAADQSEEAQGRARLANRVLDAKYILDNETENSKKAAYYALVFGTVIRKDYWDATIGREAEIPEYDELGNEVMGEDGKVKMNGQKTGDSNVAILTPLSVGFDWSTSSFKELPYIHEGYLMPIQWIKDSYDKDEPGYTGRAKDVTEGTSIGQSLSVLEQMKYATPLTYGNGNKSNIKGKGLVIEMYIAPNDQFPKGRFIIKACGEIVYDSYNEGDDLGSPYFMAGDRVMWHPYTFFCYQPYVGRLLGKSLVEGMIPLQMRLNELNGSILQNANTVAKPDWLAAEDQFKRGVLNGQGAQINVYRPRSDAPPPSKIPGTPLPAQFFKEKQDLIDALVREAGTNFANGQIPAGVTAAAAIQQIFENSSGQLSDMQISWVHFHEQAFTKKLRILRNFAQLPMQDVVDYMRTLDRDALDEDIQSLVGEDIGDGITVKIEEQSMIPKSQVAKRDLYKTMIEGPMAHFFQEDSPRGELLRATYFKEFGEEGFETDQQVDVEKAKWENERMLKMKSPVFSEDDNDAIHLSCHTTETKKPRFLERASPQIKQMYLEHIAQHKQAAQAKQAQQMQQQSQMQAQAMGQQEQIKTQGMIQKDQAKEQAKAGAKVQEHFAIHGHPNAQQIAQHQARIAPPSLQGPPGPVGQPPMMQ